MCVADGLTCGLAAVDTDVQSVDPRHGRDFDSNLVNKFEQLCPLSRIELFNSTDVNPRHNKSMPFRNRESIKKRNRRFVLRHEPRCSFDLSAEWTRTHFLSIYRLLIHAQADG